MNTNLYYIDAVKNTIIANTYANDFGINGNTQEIINEVFSSDKIKIETEDTIIIVKSNLDINKIDPFHFNLKDLLCFIVENNVFFEDVVSNGFMCHNDFGTFKITAK